MEIEIRLEEHNPENLTNLDSLTRNDIVPYYIMLILTNAPNWQVLRINSLIRSKYKISSLIYIKEKALKGVSVIEDWRNRHNISMDYKIKCLKLTI